MRKTPEKGGRPALPRKWILPIRLAACVAILAAIAFIFFNIDNLEMSHLFIFVPIAGVCSMALLDCRMSEAYWAKVDVEEKRKKKEKEKRMKKRKKGLTG
ncbi:MAG: hypothetical protein GXP10_06305 [Gammaproteobacteria bacterium]|nr:hypothetical protein [Gammaproteobacteria bacterium]